MLMPGGGLRAKGALSRVSWPPSLHSLDLNECGYCNRGGWLACLVCLTGLTGLSLRERRFESDADAARHLSAVMALRSLDLGGRNVGIQRKLRLAAHGGVLRPR